MVLLNFIFGGIKVEQNTNVINGINALSPEVRDVVEALSLSSGVNYLKDGYIDYAKEVIKNRALPDIYDGLKPVHRHILWTLKNGKYRGLTKCAKIAGDTMSYHPHGDTAIYEAMVLMTDVNGSLAVPTLYGNGNFGGVYKTDKAAAPRYTEAMLSDWAQEYFGELNGISMIPNYDSTLTEPVSLPVSFPAVLVNASTGIAVGFKCNIPSFNFNDVCNLVIEYIEKGECTTVIAPDFVTGGYYIKNNKELLKLMQTGTARLKLRAKTLINGKDIDVVEVPYGKTIQGIMKQINNKNLSSVRKCYDTDDFAQDSCFIVEAVNKMRAEEALYSCLKETDLQYTFSADITIIQDDVPKRYGVWKIIEEWVKWRREVLSKDLSYRYSVCKQAMREAEAFMNVVNNREKCEALTALMVKEGRDKGYAFVRDNWSRDEVPEDLINFVCHRRLPDYYDGGKYASSYASKSAELVELQNDINDVDSVIIRQMKRLMATIGAKLPRKTEVTNTDYEFAETEVEDIKDTSTVVYSMKGNNFLRKLHYNSGESDVKFEFTATASDTLIAIDNRGRILRIYTEDLPMNSVTDLGTYIPTYCGFEETDDYEIKYLGVLDGKTLTVVYKDGNIGFVDEQEWMASSRNVRVLETGIAVSIADKIGTVIEGVPEMLFVTDEAGCVACTYMDTIKRKDRKAKTRAFTLRKGVELDSYAAVSVITGMRMFANLSNYVGRLTPIKDKSDVIGDLTEFVLFE